MTSNSNTTLPVPTTPTSLSACLELSDELLFTEGMLSRVYSLIEQTAGPLVADVTTPEGRKEINKTSKAVGGALEKLDKKRREYVAELKARPAGIDKVFRETLRKPTEMLKAKIRAPLDEWTEQQRAAEEDTDRLIEELNAPVEIGTSTSAIAKRLEDIRDTDIPDWLSENQMASVVDAVNRAVKKLEDAHAAAVQTEAQAEEMERLREVERKANEERIAREATEKAKQEAEAKAQQESERAERELQRQAQARLDAERRALDAEQKQRDAEANAKREQEAAAARARTETLETFRRKQEEEARKEAQRRQEELKRSQNQEHRKQINRDAAAELVMCTGISSDQAHAVVVAIVRGQIPNVTITY